MCFPGRRRGTRVAGGRCATGDAETSGEAFVWVGVRSIQFGVAALVLGFVLKMPGRRQARQDIGLRGERPGISVFGTIHRKFSGSGHR